MQLTESSIFINLKKLRERLYGAQFHMNKADRIIYGTPLMEASGQSLGEFVLAFLLNGEGKLEHLECSIAWFTRLRVDLEFCISENIIKFKKREEKLDASGNPIPFENPEDKVSTQKVELFRLVAKIDEDICKWRSALAKGKTIHEEK